jgi:glycosyltransferase involved in cell wall biosynthesis
MNIYAPKGLHHGVFQSLDASLCYHNFYVNHWIETEKPKPNNVFIMTKEQLENPDDSFFGAILVQSVNDYQLVSKFAKPILYYDLMNGRSNGPQYIYSNPNVVPVFVSTGCRLSHGVFDGPHKTIYPAIDDEYWNGWTGEEKKIIHVRNAFKERDPNKFNEFLYICGENPYTLVGRDGNMECGYEELRNQFRKHRVFVNVEIFTSTFSISSMEAMMCGMPIVCNDIEGTGEAIRNGIEGFIGNNLAYLKKKTNDILNDEAMAKELGHNAREMAKMKFGKRQFNLAWNDFLDNLAYYRRA